MFSVASSGGSIYVTPMSNAIKDLAPSMPTHTICPLCGKSVKIHKTRGTISRHGHRSRLGLGGGHCDTTGATPGAQADAWALDCLRAGLEYWRSDEARKRHPRFRIIGQTAAAERAIAEIEARTDG